MTALVAFVCGLIALSCFTNADVSHLQQSKTQYTGHRQRAHNSAASNGNANNNRYWWLRNTDNTNKQQSTSDQIPNTSNSVSNYVSNTGCNGCASQKVRLNRQNSNTPHNTAAYIRQNSYSNAKQSQQQQPNYYQKQPVSGFNSFQSFDSGRIQQQQQQSQSCSDLNSACVAQRFCNSGFIDSSFESKAVRSSTGRCNAPEVCCRFSQRRRTAQYQDNTVSEARQGTSEVLTKEGYVVNKPSNQYLPSYNDAPSNVNPTRVPGPSRPPPQRQNPPPYQPQPSNNRPVVQYDPAPIVIPVGCSAAMNCTNVQYCTAAGVISKTPVSLTPQQEMFRVPLTDCRNKETQEVGKCCRDPDYVDPWPVGRTGQYVPEELNAAFPSGKYEVRTKPDGYEYKKPQPQPSNQQRLYLPPNRI